MKEPTDWLGPEPGTEDDPAVRVAGITGFGVEVVRAALARLRDDRYRSVIATKVAAKAPGSAAHAQ